MEAQMQPHSKDKKRNSCHFQPPKFTPRQQIKPFFVTWHPANERTLATGGIMATTNCRPCGPDTGKQLEAKRDA